MSGAGRKVVFHGAFKSRADASRKCHAVHGAIIVIRVRGQRRYAVITRRKS